METMPRGLAALGWCLCLVTPSHVRATSTKASVVAVCVKLHAEHGPNAAAQTKALVDLLRARIPKPLSCEATCPAGRAHGEYGYRLEVFPPDNLAVGWRLRGPGVRLRQRLPIRGLDEEEVMRFVALNASEALRPVADRLLQELRADEALRARKDLTRLRPSQGPSPPAGPRPVVGLTLGAVLMTKQPAQLVTGFAAIEGGLRWRFNSVWLRFGVRLPERATHAGVELSGWVLDLALGIRRRWHWLEAGISGIARLTLTDATGSNPWLESDVNHTAFSAGAALDVGAWPLRLGRWEFGLTFTGRFWGWAEQLEVAGHTMWAQSHVEFLLGPGVRVGW